MPVRTVTNNLDRFLDYSSNFVHSADINDDVRKGGHGVHIASASSDWPIFQHLLPEVAFAGHSNSGKSTLVNAMIGVLPRKGPAKVSDRAGWTDQICFYKVLD